MVKKSFSFFLSILLIEMVIFILILPGCKGRSPILPGMPDAGHQYQHDNGSYRHSYGSGSNVRMIATGPEEIFKSKLNPPRIINTMPVFSAVIEGNITPLSIDDFKARIDFKDVKHNISGNEVSFTPEFPFEGGEHRAELFFKNPDGYPLTITWEFIVAVDPPEISAVFLNDYGTAIVFLDHRVEPDYLTDYSQWKLNGNDNVLESKIEIFNMDNLIVQFTFLNSAFEAFKTAGSAELSLTDNVGTGTYALDVPKGIMLDGGGGNCYPNSCHADDCSSLNSSFCICDRGVNCGTDQECPHEPFENEDYAIVWKKDSKCTVDLVMYDYAAIPVGNSNPESVPYYQTEDMLTEGPGHFFANPTNPIYSGPYLMVIRNKSIGTLKFPANWKHINLQWEALCNYCWNDGQGNPHWERTSIGSGLLNFNSAFDSTNPDFPDISQLGITTYTYQNPVVLYGFELADYLEDIFSKVPLRDDSLCYYDPPNDKKIHCYGKKRSDFEVYDSNNNLIGGELYSLRVEHCCDLFVFAAAEDKAHQNPYYPQDEHHKRIFPVLGLQVYAEGQSGPPYIDWGRYAHPNPGMAIPHEWECDFKPWGAPEVWSEESGYPNFNFPDDFEIHTVWEDPDIQEVPDCRTSGCPYHERWLAQDYNETELAFQWWNLTTVLEGLEDYPTVDIRIFLEDEVLDPVQAYQELGHFYNWRRSENVMEQLSGSTLYATVKFVGENPNYGTSDWKIYNYSGETNDLETSFISRRSESGETFLDLIIFLQTDAHIKPGEEETFWPEGIKVIFKSYDESNTATATGYAWRYNYYAQHCGNPPISIARLLELFDNDKYRIKNPLCAYKFYYTQLKVTDNSDIWFSNANPGDPCSKAMLYVSSRDHKLGSEGNSSIINMLDYAESQTKLGGFGYSYDDAHGVPSGYGFKNRGLGLMPSGKEQWYGYDEFLINGGYEVVGVLRIEPFNDTRPMIIHPPEASMPYVPVQSEADVMIIHGNGIEIGDKPLWDGNEQLKDRFQMPMNQPTAAVDWYPRVENNYRPNYLTIASNKAQWEANMECFLGTNLIEYFENKVSEKALGYGDTKYKHYSDCSNTTPYPWGGFWLNKYPPPEPGQTKWETRWLVLVTCSNVSDFCNPGDENYRSDLNWQQVINDGYLQSVCGFNEPIQTLLGFPFTVDPPTLIKNYSEILKELVLNKYKSYCPNTDCYYIRDAWGPFSYTRDPSIAAWMEAAWKTIVESKNPEELMKRTAIDSATAVDGYDKWYLYGVQDYKRKLDTSILQIRNY